VEQAILAVDVGGTKISVGVVSAEGDLLERHDAPTPGHHDGDDLFAELAALVAKVDAGDAVACGVGCGGPMAPHGEAVSPLNIPAWRGFPLRGRLAELTGLPTFVDNDAKALALGEGWRGAAEGCDDFLAMVVSTGVGGGIVLDGRLLDGRLGNAGHVGHVVVEPDGRACRCGGRGCLEAEASGLAIEAVTGAAPKDAPEAVRVRTGTLVGRGVASVVQLLDLDLVVVAGSVALGYGDVFFAAAQAELSARAGLEYARSATIRPAGLGSSGPLIGAAAVARLRLADGPHH
jgi:glucokinase